MCLGSYTRQHVQYVVLNLIQGYTYTCTYGTHTDYYGLFLHYFLQILVLSGTPNISKHVFMGIPPAQGFGLFCMFFTTFEKSAPPP